MATGFLWDERYAWHDTGSAVISLKAGGYYQPDAHLESPESKRRMRNLIEVSGLLDDLTPIRARPAAVDELARFHTREYIARIQSLSAANGGDAGELTPFGPGGYEIAALSAGGAIVAVDAVLDGRVRNAYALVRPPGHHAERDKGRGFCLFSNVALAALHAREARGIGRIAIVDWDVHHGNGTQQAFYEDPNVLFISLHQAGLYPRNSGLVEETGAGAGIGATINVPLPPGSGRGAYIAAFERVVIPALDAFRPELILVSSGFDGGNYDPLGRMMLSASVYRDLTRMLMDAADRHCDGRLVLVHEGGYSPGHVPFCGLAVLEELSGLRTEVHDLFDAGIEALPYQELQHHQDAAIRAAETRSGD